jgi:DNA-binding MarR family transcriptional regulator
MSKSKKYQHKIVEVRFDQSYLNNFPEERGMGNILEENSPSEEMVAFRKELLDELYNIIHSSSLTDHQRKVLLMRVEGKTQNHIAQHLGITQSAVHKALHGNIDYKNDKKRYGGVYKKLKKQCAANPKIQDILRRIEEYKEKKYADMEEDGDLY